MRAQICFGACYMSFKVSLWHNIAEINCSVHKGMGHIILDDIMLNVDVILPIFAVPFNISLAPARWPSS